MKTNNYLQSGFAFSAGIFSAVGLFFMIILMSSPWKGVDKQLPVMIDFMAWQNTEKLSRKKILPPAKSEHSKKKLPPKMKKKVKPVKQEISKITQNEKLEPESVIEQQLEKVEDIATPEVQQIHIPERQQMGEVSDEFLPNPVPFFKLTDSPQFLHREIPEYPESMRATGRKGVVILAVLIDSTGKVRKVTVLKSDGVQFDQAAIKGLQASSFTPAKIDGKSVAVLLRMPVEFRLL